jgi:hypothetical protein
MNLIKSLLLFMLLSASLFPSMGWAQPAVNTFSTGGYTVYHLLPATVERNGAKSVSNKELPIRKHGISLVIPMGTLRIVDLIKE